MQRIRIIRTLAATLALGLGATGLAVTQQATAASATVAPTTSAVPTWAEGKPGTYLLHIDGSTFDVATEAKRRRLFIMQPWENAYVAQIKAVNPSAIVLAYKDLSSTRDYACHNGVDDSILPTGVGYCFANANHPDWFLKDSAGNRLTYDSWAGHWQMDVSNPGYRSAWLANVESDITNLGFDGVFMDNALTAADDYHPGTVSPSYATNTALQSAYSSFLGSIGSGMRSIGKVTMANIGNARLFPGVWNSYTSALDAGFEEHFVDWVSSPTATNLYEWDWAGSGWSAQLGEITNAASNGRITAVEAGVVTPDQNGFTYALGTYLLGNDGRQLFSFCDTNAWHPEYGWDLGAAQGAPTQLQTSVWRRSFASGQVLVNAGQTAVTIPLGATFLDATGASVTSVTLGGTRAAILRTLPTSTTTTTAPATTTTTAPATTTTTAPATTTTTAPATTTTTAPATTSTVTASSTSATTTVPDGYRVVTSSGTVAGFGGEPSLGSAPLSGVAAMASTPSRGGYWVTTSTGAVAALGDARFLGSTAGVPLSAPIVGMAATPTGNGYWLVASDGGIFAFGDAGFFGSTGGMKLNKPIVGMTATKSGSGYWLVASDGGIFAFGDARFFGSTGAMKLNKPIVGMASTPAGSGYWLVASDGGIFAFGDAGFFGSTGAMHLNKPIVGMSVTKTGSGYRFVASDGGVFSFGDATFLGSLAAQQSSPIVGMAS